MRRNRRTAAGFRSRYARSFQGKIDPAKLTERLNALSEGAAFLLGHNILRHDLPASGIAQPR